MLRFNQIMVSRSKQAVLEELAGLHLTIVSEAVVCADDCVEQ